MSAMRLAWCTPFSPQSDIGAHSRCIVEALPEDVKRGSCVFVDGPRGLGLYASSVRQVALTDHVDAGLLDMFDHVVLNIGNNERNHRHINRLALARGGVVVVHDIIMQHYLAWLCFEQHKAPAAYAELMAEYGGAAGLDILEQSEILSAGRTPRFAPWDSEHAMAVPLIEPFLQNAQAIVVHSAFAHAILQKLTDAPILRLFLPSDKKPAPPPRGRIAPGERVVFAAIGHMGRAKQLHLAIEAFARSPLLRESARLTIAGAPTDPAYASMLEAAVATHGLGEIVRFAYDLSEEGLLDVKREADVFINIRYPHAESASGSLTEQMAAGRAVIVKDSGCYREIPDRAVVKITSVDDAHDLMAAMERLCADAALRERLSAAAAAHVAPQTGAAYGRLLIEGLRELEGASTRHRGFEPHWLAETHWRMPAIPPWIALDAGQAARLFGLQHCRTTDGRFDRARVEMVLQPYDALDRVRIASRYRGWLALLDAGEVPDASLLDERLDPAVFDLMLAFDERRLVLLVHNLLFARPPQAAEVRQWRAGLETSAARTALIEQGLQSAEHRAQHVGPRMTERLRRVLCGHGNGGGARTPPQPWPAQILFGGEEANAGPLLFGDWHAPEHEGRWMAALEGGIRAVVPQDLGQNDHLLLAVRVAGTPLSGPRRCSVYLNEHLVLDHVFADDDRAVLRIPLGSLAPGSTLVLHVALNAAINLSAFGEADTRDLAMFFYNALYERGAPPTVRPPARNPIRIRGRSPPRTTRD